MNQADEQFESDRRLVRAIHGELRDEESLELNRQLIRDPHLRALHDEFANVDRLAGDALAALLAAPKPSAAAPVAPAPSRSQRWWAQIERWFVPAAVAAMILIAVAFPSPRSTRVVDRTPEQPVGMPQIGGHRPSTGTPVGMQQPTNLKRNTSRDVIGVIDRDGKIWILELDRTQTLRIPGTGSTSAGSIDGL